MLAMTSSERGSNHLDRIAKINVPLAGEVNTTGKLPDGTRRVTAGPLWSAIERLKTVDVVYLGKKAK